MVSSVMRENFKQTHQQRRDRDFRSIRTLPLRFTLLIVVVSFTCIIEAASVNGETNEPQSTNSAPKGTLCNSTICQIEASHILSLMDEREEPCNNFFRFACGGWIDKSVHPIHLELVVELKSIERKLLKSNVTTPDPNVNKLISKMRTYYRNCINVFSTNPDEDQINHLLSQVPLPYITTGWKDMELEVILSKLDLLEVYILFKPEFFYEPYNSSLHNFLIDQPPTKITKWILRYFEEEFRFQRKAVITEVLEKVYEYFNITNVTIDAEAIVNLELLIINATQRDQSRCCHEERKMSISQFNSSMSNFDWIKYLDQLMSHESPIPNITLHSFPNDYIITVGEPRYFEKLNEILRDNNIKKTIGMFATFRLLEKFRHILPKPYYNIFKDFAENLSRHFRYYDGWGYCINRATLLFRDILGRLYSQEYFDQATKARVDQMTERIKNVLMKRVDSITWMDKVPKEILSRKIQKIGHLMGFPDRFYDTKYLEKWYGWVVLSNKGFILDEIEITKGHRITKYLRPWLRKMYEFAYRNMVDINAYSYSGFFKIVIPMGMFKTTTSLLGVPQYLNYGRFGFLIGHEMSHLLNGITLQYLEKGGNPTDYSNKTLETFKNISHCIIDKYSKFRAPFEDMNNTFDTNSTKGELLADHVGYRLALEAYDQLIKENGKAESQLPGMDYTPDQLIFISAAQLICERDERLYWTRGMSHPSWTVRYNGFTANNQKFQEAFQCRPKDKHHAAGNCGLW